MFPAHQQPQIRAQLSLVLEGIMCQSLLPKVDGKGRAMCMEILVPNAAVRNLIREDKIHQIYSSMQSGQDKFGMQTFNQSLATAYFQKQITLEMAMTRSSNQDELQEMINRGASLLNRNQPAAAMAKASGARASAKAAVTELCRARPAQDIESSKPEAPEHGAGHGRTSTQPGEVYHASVYIFGKERDAAKKSAENAVAANKQTLTTQLRRERITPGPIREKGKEFAMPTFGSGKVKVKDIAIFFRQFSVMIDAGLPLVQCLEILAANQENPAFQKTLTGVRTTVEGGATLANAMRQYPKIFDDLTTNMIEAGETGGILDIILQRLALYVEKAVKLRAAVKSALIYPVSVVHLAFLIVGALLKWVVPIFANLFAGLGVDLAPAHAHCDWAERFRRPVLVVLLSWASVGLFFGVKQIRKDPTRRATTSIDAC